MAEALPLIKRLRAIRSETLQRLVDGDDARLESAAPFRGAVATLRMRLSLLSEADDGLRGRLFELLEQAGRRETPAQRAVVVLGAARGALEGSLLGIPPAAYDRPPAPNEWPLRRVLAHVIANDLRYLAAVRFACERQATGRGGPLRPPSEGLPPSSGESEDHGTAEELIASLRRTRHAVMRYVAAIPNELLDAPTNWVSWDFDVRFRLYRFASHDREHTIQLRKTRNWLGLPSSETQLLLADACAERGALEAALLALPDDLLTGTTAAGASLAALIEPVLGEELDLHALA